MQLAMRRRTLKLVTFKVVEMGIMMTWIQCRRAGMLGFFHLIMGRASE